MSSNLVLSGSSQPVTHPSYGDDLTAELEEYDEYYDEEEGEGGLEPDKALAKVQEYLAGGEQSVSSETRGSCAYLRPCRLESQRGPLDR